MGSIFIEGDTKAVWEALTKEEQLTKWYAPGSQISIPLLEEEEKMTLTLPGREPLVMIIDSIIPFQEFAFSKEGLTQQVMFRMKEDAAGITVNVNLSTYDDALARLKALIEGDQLPYQS